MAQRIPVCPAAELEPGERTIVDVEELPHEVGVFNIDGEYYALANVCPHHLAPLCEGEITGKMIAERVGEYELVREGELIQCPWHGWKFDIRDGNSVVNPHSLKTRTYETAVEPEESSPAEIERFGTELAGEEPPIDTYDVELESEYVVLYV